MIASLILGLHLLGFIPMENAAVFLFIYGGLLVLAEFFLPSGLAAFNGVLSLIAGFALYAGPESVLGLYVGWGVFFGIAFAEFFVLGACIFLLLRYRRQKITTGAESMIGQEAAVLEWNGKGRVRIQGETWQAESDDALDLPAETKVTVSAIRDLTLKITTS